METALDLWADPNVDYATSWSDFMIGDLMCAEHPVSLFVTTPQAHADRLAFLVRVYMRSVVNSLMESETLDTRGRRKKHRLLLMIDEFPKIGRLPFIEGMLGEMTSYGFTAHFVCQTFADIYQTYGRDTSLFGNFKVTAVCNVADTSGFKEVIDRAGKAREMRRGFSDPRGLITKGHRSVSLSEQVQDILTSDQVRGLPEDEQFLFITGAKPIRSKKVRYFQEPLLRAHASRYHHDNPDLNLAAYQQRRGAIDAPRQSEIVWLKVEPIVQAPPYVPPAPDEKGGGAKTKTVVISKTPTDSAAGLPGASNATLADIDAALLAAAADFEKDD
jgi:type IV secretion system protein VirD4